MAGLEGSPLLATDELDEARHRCLLVEDGDEEALSHGSRGQILSGQACTDDADDARRRRTRADPTAAAELGRLLARRRLSCVAAAGLLVVLAVCARTAWRKARQGEVARAPAGRGRVGLSEIHFELVADGSCKSHGYHPINDLFYCEAAATDLGLADLSAIQTEFPGIPEGCYYFQDKEKGVEGLWLGTNADNKGNGAMTAKGGKTRRPICTMAMPSTTTLRPTTSKSARSGADADSQGAAQGSEGFKVGDVVKVRDRAGEAWEYGFVTSVDPLRAKPYGWHKGFAWKLVEHIDLKTLGEELAVKKRGGSGGRGSESGEAEDGGAESGGAGEKRPEGGSEKEESGPTSEDREDEEEEEQEDDVGDQAGVLGHALEVMSQSLQQHHAAGTDGKTNRDKSKDSPEKEEDGASQEGDSDRKEKDGDEKKGDSSKKEQGSSKKEAASSEGEEESAQEEEDGSKAEGKDVGKTHAARSKDSAAKAEDSDKEEEDDSKEEERSSKREEDSPKEQGQDRGKTHGHKEEEEEVKGHGHGSSRHEREKEQREKTASAPKEIIKGISYAPVPSKHPKRLENDDFMSENTSALWGSHGRGDLAVISSMGANVVRLYGNDPRLNHKAFLDEAHSQGLGVILGFSDYPYIQMRGNCISTHFDCYAQIKEQFAENLRRGFLDKSPDGKAAYHPALRTVIIMNEPDLKFFPISEPWHFCKALLSAFDAVLDAEREAGVDADFAGPLPNFTATFSFAVCASCKSFGMQPAVGQMWELRKAMEDPSSVGYQAKNDLWSAYHTRFMNSFNTANPATDIRPLFLDTYDSHFQGTPVFIGEYHAPSKVVNQREDLQHIVNIAKDENTLLTGLSFFEFQVRYDKGGSELMFGMFGLGEEVIDKIRIGSSDFQVRCIAPMAPAIERKATPLERSCGLMESTVEYVVDSEWTNFIAGVRNPDDCCTKCKDAPRCKSWTWDLSPIHGLSCVLNGAAPQDEGGKSFKESAVSGFPPPRDMEWKEENTLSADVKALVPEALTEVYGGEGIEYSKLCLASKLMFFMYA